MQAKEKLDISLSKDKSNIFFYIEIFLESYFFAPASFSFTLQRATNVRI